MKFFFFTTGDIFFKQEVKNDAVYHAHSINGVFGIRSVQGKSVITFSATLIKRFSVAVAYFVDGLWRLRYRLVVTLQDGVLGFLMHKTIENRNGVYRIPAEFDVNTALIIGIASPDLKSEVKLRIYANKQGCINDGFNGYEGTVSFDKFLDRASFSDTLKEQKYGNTIRFDRNLYQFVQRHQPEGSQHLNSEETWCLNCLLISNRTINDIIHNYRTNVYGQKPMSMFKIRIENPNDVLYILDKKSGIFKV